MSKITPKHNHNCDNERKLENFCSKGRFEEKMEYQKTK
jgi:hypothetical protein